MDSRKRILVISSKRPFPVQDGASIRTSQMIRMLSQIFEVDLVYTCNPYKTFADLTELRCFCRQISEFLEPNWKCVLRALLGFFKSRPLQCSYFYSPRMMSYIQEHLSLYDYVFCNNIRTVPYVDGSKCNKIIDYVDAISMNYIGASLKANWIWRLVYKFEANRLISYENKVLKSFDKFIIISDVDRQFILRHADLEISNKHIEVIGNSVDFDDQLIIPNDSRNIVFVGSMFYEPNIVAVTTFVRYVLPLILLLDSSVRFYIVGSRPSASVCRLASEHVIITGFVDDPKFYLKKASVVVVPMYSGAGVQNKIIEAMSIGCCVVTTEIGAEGLEGIVDGEHIFIRTDFQKMADTIIKLMDDRSLREKIGKQAKKYIADNLIFDHIYDKFKKVFYDFD